MKTIKTVICRRRFDKINGNSYYTLKITDTKGETIKTERQYGYGNMEQFINDYMNYNKGFRISKKAILIDVGYLKRKKDL